LLNQENVISPYVKSPVVRTQHSHFVPIYLWDRWREERRKWRNTRWNAWETDRKAL